MIRKMYYNGSFYPSDAQEVLRYINHFNKILDDANVTFEVDFKPKVIISPHAGYVYSGFSANYAYKCVSMLAHPKRIVVFGPSHRVYLEGLSIAMYDSYSTPFGELDIDLEYSNKLKDKYHDITFEPSLHEEHSTETQMPFIKHYFGNVKVVEIVYGKINPDILSKIINDILSDSDNIVVISTDLSHFYDQKTANSLDSICLRAIEEKNLSLLDNGCEACGKIGVKAVLKCAIENNWKTKILDYRTSFDASGDDNRVVGYTSCLIG
ncbi:AmmeMemoRadiSam system protein B [Arcobacter sp. FWKO B]|uniref:AmmeMemoRadiSam system protein B n=1 Tax=Arcobacter sp. FWKO B TaxID=2593672 RepID=UPI0018A39953|nr:AmmeMemoRadiSam system protein B [Arcobacter sp. FWKO B]QOG12055.1 AmmeMemoRadiSam system protein B [Arcobacter sp. FWKO B]